MYELAPEEQLMMQNALESPEVSEKLSQVSKALQEIGRRICEVLLPTIRKIVEVLRVYLDKIFQIADSQNYHLYKNAKKARTRKKYKNRIIKELHRWLK